MAGEWPRPSLPAERDFWAPISATTCSPGATASSASTTWRRALSGTSSTSAPMISSSSTTTWSIASRSRRPVDVVYHLAALASPIDYLRQPLHSLKVGSYGTHNALGLAKHKRARFLLASTSEVYGDPARPPAAGELLGERQPDRPARGLRRGEALRRGADDGLPRPAGRRHARSCASSTRTARACARTTAVRSRRSSARRSPATRSPSSATDRRRGASATSTTSSAGCTCWRRARSTCRSTSATPASSRCSSWRSSSCASQARRARSCSRRCRWTIPKVRQPDITRAQQVLGWEPEVSLEEGLRRLIDSTQARAEIVGA